MFFGDNGRIEPEEFTGVMTLVYMFLYHSMASWSYATGRFSIGQVDEQVVSLIDMTPTTLVCWSCRPLGMHGRIFLGDSGWQERRYAFSARDRIDETVNRVRVFVVVDHYIQTIFQTDILRH